MSNTIPLIYKKMSEVMRDVGSISKDQRNQAQGFAFRGIDQFCNALYPALVAHGVFMVPRCTSQTNEVREVERGSGKKGFDKIVTLMMEYDFFAEDGSKVTVGPIPAEGLDSGDKATNKALSAALKYTLIQTFTVPTKDMEEADKDSPSLAPAPRKDIVKEVAAKTAPAPAPRTTAAPAAPARTATAATSAPSTDKKTISFKRTATPAPAPAPTQDAEPEIEM